VGNIPTAEAFGTAKLHQQISEVGAIATGESFGASKLNQQITAVGGIASGESFGVDTVSGEAGDAQSLTSVGAIASGETFGKVKVRVFTPPPPQRQFQSPADPRHVEIAEVPRDFRLPKRRKDF
jgi:hypothetical protein